MEKTKLSASIRGIIAAVCVICVALIVLLIVNIVEIRNYSKTLNDVLTADYFEPEPEEPAINSIELQRLTILNQSIALCKNKYAERIANAVIAEYERQGCPVPVIYALIGTESDETHTNNITTEHSGYFNPHAKSSKSCRGLTQISRGALDDFNTFNKFGHTYTWDEMFEIEKNIEVGVWHFMRYTSKVDSDDYIALYIIYNVGFGGYSKKNNVWIYNEYTEKWEEHANSYYYRNNKYPPVNSHQTFDTLTGFAPTNRFSTYLNMYMKLFA